MPFVKKRQPLYFVEIVPIANAPEAIAEERIQIESPVANQHVTLLSVVQDVEFYISTENSPKILTDNTSWNNTKAKIIYGDLKLADGKSLTISEGNKSVFSLYKMPI